LIVSPSPYGTCADLARIADICHQRGKPLIVDEAWGVHLPFHADLPTWAMDAGADVCVVSVHKMGAGFEQGSVFHVQGDLVDRDRLSACAGQLMTTSPNVMIYAALDGWPRRETRFSARSKLFRQQKPAPKAGGHYCVGPRRLRSHCRSASRTPLRCVANQAEPPPPDSIATTRAAMPMPICPSAKLARQITNATTPAASRMSAGSLAVSFIVSPACGSVVV
jgi:hypothetical protein